MPENTLYFGDNLDILRRYIDEESVDLIYLDPPFNSNQAYNVIFEEDNGSGSGAQIEAFDDTWHWTMETARDEEGNMCSNGEMGDGSNWTRPSGHAIIGSTRLALRTAQERG